MFRYGPRVRARSPYGLRAQRPTASSCMPARSVGRRVPLPCLGMVLRVVLAFVVVAVVLWLAFLVMLLVARPDTSAVRASLRLLPDVARLCARLARDRSVSRSVRVRLWFLLGYL